jgi:cytochrome c
MTVRLRGGRCVIAAAAAAAILLVRPGAATAAGDAALGEKIFLRCKACHTVEAGSHKVGPSLAGVFGRKAGSAEGFKYSEPMAKADIVWDDATLDAYLANPKQYIPGNRMAFPGLSKEQDRANVIAYLHQAAPP